MKDFRVKQTSEIELLQDKIYNEIKTGTFKWINYRIEDIAVHQILWVLYAADLIDIVYKP